MKMDKFFGVFIGLWIEKKVEQLCIRGQYRKKRFEKCFLLNQNTNDDDFLLTMGIEGISGKGLTNIDSFSRMVMWLSY